MKKSYKLLNIVMASSILVSPVSALALTKDETVYTNLDAYGNTKKVIVSNHLSNVNDGDTEDETILKNILNINGSEEYTLNNNKLTWKTQGNDIIYQGESEKDTPITTSIKYYLDGKEIKESDLNGKSGNVKIEIKLKNNDLKTVKVNGKNTKLYVPYVTTIGAVLNDDVTNVKINNGKVVSTGSKNVIVGIASPGLYDSLKLSELKDLDNVTIEYTTKSFKFSTMYIVSSPKLLSETDMEVFDKLDNLTDSISELQTNMNKIEEGSKELAQGSDKLANGSKQLVEGSKNLVEGSNKVSTGSTTLKTSVNSSVKSLNSSINKGINKTFTDAYLNEIGEAAWSGVQESLANSDDTTVIEIVTNEGTKVKNSLTTAATETATNSAKNAVISYLTSVNELNDYINCNTGKGAIEAGVQESLTPEQLSSCYVIQSDSTLPYIIKASEEAAKGTAQGIASSATPIISEALENSVGSSVNYVAEKVSKDVAKTVAYNTAVSTGSSVSKQVTSSLKELSKGVDALDDGIQAVNNGVITLDAGINSLNDGIVALNEGINTLNNGIIEFNDKGICVLSEYAEKIDNYSSKAEALVKLSKNYKGYGSNNSDNTTFISIVKNK